MKRLLLLILFLASPALGAGDASEELCDFPGSNITCVCSEPLTYNEGQTSGVSFNPVGSTGNKQCHPLADGFAGAGLAVVCASGCNGSTDSVLASSLSNTITVGGSGYVLKIPGGSKYRVAENNRGFTGGTLCQRHYAYYSESYGCTGACNYGPKGPRMDGGGAVENCVGFQGAIKQDLEWQQPWFGAKCNTGFCGTQGVSHPRDIDGCHTGSEVQENPSSFHNPDNIDFEDMDGAWIRYEVCVDHNLSSAQVTAMNTTYEGSIVYPGANYGYLRTKITVVSGPNAGKVVMDGPGRSENPVSTIKTGSRFWMASTATGSGPLQNDWTIGNFYTAYNMVAVRSSADPNYWIGPASEVEGFGGATPTTTPTASPVGTPTSTPTTNPATPTATPTPQPVLCQMDFEGSGCVDSDAGETCSLSPGASYSADCTTGGGCPLDGLKSGYASGDGAPEDAMWMDTTHNCTSKDQVTVDFKFRWPSGSKPLRAEQFRIMTTTGQYGTGGYTMAMRQTNENIWRVCGPPGNTAGAGSLPADPGPEDDTTYNVRIDFDAANYICNIFIEFRQIKFDSFYAKLLGQNICHIFFFDKSEIY